MAICCPACSYLNHHESALKRHQSHCQAYSQWLIREQRIHRLHKQAEDRQLAEMDLDAPILPEAGPPAPVTITDTLSSQVDEALPLSQDPQVAERQATRRPVRAIHLPARFRDPNITLSSFVPLPGYHVDVPPEGPSQVPPPQSVPRVILHVRDTVWTLCNSFSLLRKYPDRPSFLPPSESTESTNILSNRQLIASSMTEPQPSAIAPSSSPSDQHFHQPPWPWLNMSQWRFMHWFTTGSSQKTKSEVNRLLDIFRCPDFSLPDLLTLNITRETRKLDSQLSDAPQTDTPAQMAEPLSDNFRSASIEIAIPAKSKESPPRMVSIEGLQFRPIVSVIKAAFQETTAEFFHLFPFKQYRRLPSGQLERVWDELYTSKAWLHAQTALQHQKVNGDEERVIAALMFWSDATQLAQFGNAKAWPLYMSFGNLSKYLRGRCGYTGAHHIAYFPSLPNSIKRIIRASYSGSSTVSKVFSHCRRELFHGAWKILLDAEFIKAYHEGILIRCKDGITRRVFPRIFTYSADYPEKVIIAGIRDLGLCGCPRCEIETKYFGDVGSVNDGKRRESKLRQWTHVIHTRISSARDFIYNRGYSIVSTAVEKILSLTSLVPTENAFPTKLGNDFDIYSTLVVDFMHEVELGTWKSLFAHLIRIFYAADSSGSLVTELDCRYQQITSFGRNTIRHFGDRASEMKQLPARGYENLLQCAIPVFEGLLPRHINKQVLTLLYRFAEWHALGKLRMQTKGTHHRLSITTRILGQEIRKFVRFVRKHYETLELPREAQARRRRKAADPTKPADSARDISGRKPKFFNLNTYKFHALGDYCSTIKWYGTTDSYSTWLGEMWHRRVKNLYSRTNKKNPNKGISRCERRETLLRRAQESLSEDSPTKAPSHSIHPHHVPFEQSERLPHSDLDLHHHISDSREFSLDIYSFLDKLGNDPAAKDFLPKMKDHLLSRLRTGFDDHSEREFPQDERNSLRILGNRLYYHKVFRVNYTTYDVRRDQDSLNPRTPHCNIMVNATDEEKGVHLFWYARILGIFHVRVQQIGRNATSKSPQEMYLLWVRWFGFDPTYSYGSKATRLPKIGFISESNRDAFGFLDPSLVVRACHLIPAFHDGRTSELLSSSSSVARHPGEEDDWLRFYVNIFADRDLFMRHLGGGVGHHSFEFYEPLDVQDEDSDSDMLDENERESEGDDEDEEEEEEESGEADNDEEVLHDDDIGAEDGEDVEYSDDENY